MAMSSTYEDIFIQGYYAIHAEWRKGILYFLKDRIIFTNSPKDTLIDYSYAKMRSVQIISAEDESKIKLKVFPYDGVSFTFKFVNKLGLTEIQNVKKHLDRLLPKFKDVKKEHEEKMRTFSENPAYWKLYKRLVLVQGISEDEFWTQNPLVDLNALEDKYQEEKIRLRQLVLQSDESDEFLSQLNQVECKRIMEPQKKKSKTKNNLQRDFSEVLSTSMLWTHLITNDEEKSGLSFSAVEPSLCGLPTEYVLYPFIFIHLSIHDILNLSATNIYMESAVKQYLSKIKIMDFSKRWYEPISDKQFKILHENCRSIRELNFNKCYWLADSQLKPLLLNNIRYLEKLILKHSEFKTLKLLIECRNLKSVKLFSYGIDIWHTLNIADKLCENNLNLDLLFMTNGNQEEHIVFRTICKA